MTPRLCKCKVNVTILLAISESDCDNSGEPGPQAEGVNHLDTPLKQLHVTHRASSCAQRGGHVQLGSKPREARGIRPETFRGRSQLLFCPPTTGPFFFFCERSSASSSSINAPSCPDRGSAAGLRTPRWFVRPADVISAVAQGCAVAARTWTRACSQVMKIACCGTRRVTNDGSAHERLLEAKRKRLRGRMNKSGKCMGGQAPLLVPVP